MALENLQNNTIIKAEVFEKLVLGYLNEISESLINTEVKMDQGDSGYCLTIDSELDIEDESKAVRVLCLNDSSDIITRDYLQGARCQSPPQYSQKIMCFSATPFTEAAYSYAHTEGIALIQLILRKYTLIDSSFGLRVLDTAFNSGVVKFVGEYRTESSIFFIQKDYLTPLKSFILK